jgi:hypothetical protein
MLMNRKFQEGTIYAGRQDIDTLTHNLKTLEKDSIEFVVQGMILEKPLTFSLMGIEFRDHKDGIEGQVKLDRIDGETVGKALEKIRNAVGILLLFFSEIDWHIKMYSIEVTAKTIVKDPGIFQRVQRFHDAVIKNIGLDFSEVYFRALELYRFARSSDNIFTEFLGYWNVIELFCDGYFYKINRPTIRRSSSEKEECIQDYFKSKKIMTVDQITRENIHECYFNCLDISARQKIEFGINKIFGDDAEMVIKKCFEEQPSLYSIRNGIAHGEISEYSDGQYKLVAPNLPFLQTISEEFLSRIAGVKRHENLNKWFEEFKKLTSS